MVRRTTGRKCGRLQSDVQWVGGLRDASFATDEQRRAFGVRAERHEAHHHLTLKQLQVLHRKLVAHAYTTGHKDFRKAFHWMDENNDGTLDVREFSHALKRTCKLNTDDLRCLQQVFDTDGNGQVGL